VLRFEDAARLLADPEAVAQQQALARMYAMLMGQAQAISYVEVYWLLAIVSVLMFFLSFLLAKNQPGAGGQVAMH